QLQTEQHKIELHSTNN
ncbi:unnamed protein product, partial [Rotaria magnacalcarata]